MGCIASDDECCSQGHTATEPGSVGWISCGGFLWLSHHGSWEHQGQTHPSQCHNNLTASINEYDEKSFI